jgi:hypothetical protein
MLASAILRFDVVAGVEGHEFVVVASFLALDAKDSVLTDTRVCDGTALRRFDIDISTREAMHISELYLMYDPREPPVATFRTDKQLRPRATLLRTHLTTP